MPENESIKAGKAKRLRQIRKELKLSQVKFGELLGIAQSNVTAYENGTRGIGRTLDQKLIYELNVNAEWWDYGRGQMFSVPLQDKTGKLVDTASINYENLTFISTKARVNFMESFSATAEFEMFGVLKFDPAESYAGQIIFEVEGDSMEPYLFDGSKIRCKEIPTEDWNYLLSGVYAVAYGNYFTIKRVKNSPVDGILALHSDNAKTSGKTEIPLSKIRKIWRALRIVDAPI